MQDFRELEVWESSIQLGVTLYHLTETLPETERWRLSDQIRRAAISVSSNIAEGAGRGSSRDFARFLKISLGSLAEIQSQMELAARIGVLRPDAELDDAIEVLRRRLIRLIARITENL